MSEHDRWILGLSIFGVAKIAWDLWRSARVIDREFRNAHVSRWGSYNG